MLAALLLLLNVVQYSRCERFDIVPSPYSPCPGESIGEPCLTLEQYVAYPSLSSNITFQLHPGNHRLDSQLAVRNINSLTMRANGSAVVMCRQEFYFSGLQQIHVSGITFAGCRMHLESIPKAKFERSLFVNQSECCYSSGAALVVHHSSVLISLCTFSNNRIRQGAIYGSHSNFKIEQTVFRNNCPCSYYCCNTDHGGAIHLTSGTLDILNSNLSSNSFFLGSDASRSGGAIYTNNASVAISGAYFSDNSAGSRGGHGGAVYISSGAVIISGTYFSDNSAGRNGHGGAVYLDGDNITVINSTFVNNRANEGRGGALYSARCYTEITLVNNLFSHNMAAYCGVMAVTEFYHYHINIIGNNFTYNRAVQYSGNNGGGVFCIRNASVFVFDNIFGHNSAASDAGVIQAEESDVIIERSTFRNNTVENNGGVLHTYFYPTSYTIIDSLFTNNQARSNGGVMYAGRAGSHVTICRSTFEYNIALYRGGVIFIIGSTLEINGASILGNTAEIGEVINAYSSNVTITNPDHEVSVSQEPVLLFCYRYDNSNATLSRTTEQTTASGTCVSSLTGATENDGVTTTTSSYIYTADEGVTTRSVTNSVEQDTAEYNLHYILPGYVAVGVSIILTVIVGFTCLLVLAIAVKVFRMKSKSQNILSLNTGDYPTFKNEYTPYEHSLTHI